MRDRDTPSLDRFDICKTFENFFPCSLEVIKVLHISNRSKDGVLSLSGKRKNYLLNKASNMQGYAAYV
jgi:hypothetical protein